MQLFWHGEACVGGTQKFLKWAQRNYGIVDTVCAHPPLCKLAMTMTMTMIMTSLQEAVLACLGAHYWVDYKRDASTSDVLLVSCSNQAMRL
jgi:hypothetical protein